MISDKTTHKAFRIHKLYKQNLSEIFVLHFLSKLYFAFKEKHKFA